MKITPGRPVLISDPFTHHSLSIVSLLSYRLLTAVIRKATMDEEDSGNGR